MKPRPNGPCASCPYRRDVPSGVWSAKEYDKLPGYDGQTFEQTAIGVFKCHQGKEEICAGWAGVHGNADSLALRLATYLDPAVDVQAVIGYESPVPLFASGAEAAEHGKRDIDAPSDKARATVKKITRARQARGKPVKYK